ncbi:MAG TPA: DNA polymerase III subunit gamma/tau [Clostridiales bacterium]|jgi:DNA polymerase-3 subunit gamma/tau|nr:DNA polymerase III subunit gamma/tau [Clostridiales bacterium]
MYQALYRKWRPKVFDDVYGREHMTAVLRQQLMEDKLSHAYLFCGTRGTGKTTCAKILAKAVNCEHLENGNPCNGCSSCLGIDDGTILDVVEMDAASNNGVGDIRTLCDKLLYLPSQVKKRVYIIDEVHMLSISAFNAILKTLEEPPSHVLFILATTEVHKIPPTVLSRCQRFDFQRIKPEVIADRVMEVARAENIPLLRDGAMVIARSSDGAMRDALTLLESFIGHTGPLDAKAVPVILGLPDRQIMLSALEQIADKNMAGVIDSFDRIYTTRGDLKTFLLDLIKALRDLMIARSVSDPKGYLDCYESETDDILRLAGKLKGEHIQYMMQTAQDLLYKYDYLGSAKRASLEAMLIRFCDETLMDSPAALLSRIAALESSSVKAAQVQTVSKPVPIKGSEPSPKKVATVESGGNTERRPFTHRVALLQKLSENPIVSTFLKSTNFYESNNRLEVACESFTMSILEQDPYKTLIFDLAKSWQPNLTDIVFINTSQTARKNDLDTLLE